MKTKAKFDPYQLVTNKIIEALEQDVIPWKKTWTGSANMPRNLSSNKFYRGINVWILGMQYSSPFWLTFKQAKDMDGNVKKGERGTQVVYWQILKKEDEETGEEKRIPLLKVYTVFNIEQIEGEKIHAKAKEILQETYNEDNEPIEIAESIVNGYKDRPKTKFKGSQPCYIPIFDEVEIPAIECFESSEEYYATLFHEYIHSTGHESRLNRDEITKWAGFGSDPYSREELVAELGAAFLCNDCGIAHKTIDNSKAYIKNWISRLKDDKKLIVVAAAKAQKAVEYMKGVTHTEKAEKVGEPAKTGNLEHSK